MKNEELKIIAISSSPRRNGNSETLLDKALSGLKKNSVVIKKLVLANLKISSCTSCGSCHKTGECVIQDDMQGVYKDLLDADILLVTSPMYFQGLTCQLKCVIDRCQALWARKYILKKELVKQGAKRIGSAILVCASAGLKDTFTGSIITLRSWYSVLDIIYKKEFRAEGLEEKDEASGNSKLLKKVEDFGKGLIRIKKEK